MGKALSIHSSNKCEFCSSPGPNYSKWHGDSTGQDKLATLMNFYSKEETDVKKENKDEEK